MLCREKRVLPGSTARAGTSVIAACGAFLHFFFLLSLSLPSLSSQPLPPPPALSRLALCHSSPPGIFVQDILEAVPIDKYFELFKPGAGGEGGFIRVAMAVYPDRRALERGAAGGHGRGGGGRRGGGGGGGGKMGLVTLALLAAVVGLAAKLLNKK